MKPSRYVAVFSVLNALTFCLTHSPARAGAHAAQSDKAAQPGDRARSHMSSNGSTNTNAQWSADPERGWVRADERHQPQEEPRATNKSKQNRGKQKANGAKGKTND